MNRGGFGLVLQKLPVSAAVLVLSQISSWRLPSGWFRSRDVADLYSAFRVPQPANISRELGKLRDVRGYLIGRRDPKGPAEWSITPTGEERAEQIVGDLDYSSVLSDVNTPLGASFLDADHPTLPPSLAPPAWSSGIRSFLDKYPFDTNVFLMTRFPSQSEVGTPLGDLIRVLREAMKRKGLTLHLASDQQIVDDLWGNVGGHMWGCRYGTGILETRLHAQAAGQTQLETLNDNVLIEIGSMLTIGRRCLILRDAGAPFPPTDLTSQIFKEIDLGDPEAVRVAVLTWVDRDLRLESGT